MTKTVIRRTTWRGFGTPWAALPVGILDRSVAGANSSVGVCQMFFPSWSQEKTAADEAFLLASALSCSHSRAVRGTDSKLHRVWMSVQKIPSQRWRGGGDIKEMAKDKASKRQSLFSTSALLYRSALGDEVWKTPAVVAKVLCVSVAQMLNLTATPSFVTENVAQARGEGSSGWEQHGGKVNIVHLHILTTLKWERLKSIKIPLWIIWIIIEYIFPN